MKIFLYKILLLLLVICAGCKKWIDIAPPAMQLYSEALFNDQEAIASAVNGLYAQMSSQSNSISAGILSLYGGLSADELLTSVANPEQEMFIQNNLDPASESILNGAFWKPGYSLIYHCNKIIEGIRSSPLPAAAKQQGLGEALVIRSLSYFYLTNLFGDVPMSAGTDFESNARQPRTPQTDIYEQLSKDLELAISYLKADYPSTEHVRANRFVANALLARVSLYAGDTQKALDNATAVIESGLFALESELNDVFLSTSKEAVWQLRPVSLYLDTPEGNMFQPFSSESTPTYVFRSSFINTFEENDARFNSWIGLNVLDGTDFYYPAKYKNRFGGPPYGEYTMILRLAEQYLIRAEAYARKGDFEAAANDINLLRRRAALADINIADIDNAIQAILKERQAELFAEWGHRWLDLKRMQVAGLVLRPVKGDSWKETAVLYPIPFSEIQVNAFLIQNPGY